MVLVKINNHLEIKARIMTDLKNRDGSNRDEAVRLHATRSNHFTKEDLNAIVTAKEELSARQMIIRVVTDGWDLPFFEAGQFAVLGLPGSAARCRWSDPENPPSEPDKFIRRAYSIASSSLVHEFMEFYIGLVVSGALTPRLFALGIGDGIWLSPKVSGMFTFDDVPADKNIVLIATGTGLAPYMSMLSTHLHCGGSRRFAVLHGAYHSWDLGYRSELLTLQNLCDNFSYVSTIDRPEDEPVPWVGPVGFVQSLWRKGLIEEQWGFKPTPQNTHVFLCGNLAMIEEAEQMLIDEGFQDHSHNHPGQIHVERY
jgi:ferredoxin--NADP+ reductase